MINNDSTHTNSEQLSPPESTRVIHQLGTIISEVKVEENDISLNQQLNIAYDKEEEEAQCLHTSNNPSLQTRTPCPDENSRVQPRGGGFEKKDIVIDIIAEAAALQKNDDLLRSLHREKEQRISNDTVRRIEQEAQQQTDLSNSFITSTFQQQHSTSHGKKISSSSKKKKVKRKGKDCNRTTRKEQQKQQDCSDSLTTMNDEIEDDMEFLIRESERVSREQPAYQRILNVTETAMRAANPTWDPYYQPPAKGRISTSERNKISKNLDRKLQDLKGHRNSTSQKTTKKR